MQMGQTTAIDVCSEVCLQLDKEDPRITVLYNSTAELDFKTRFEQFENGADLRDVKV